MGGGSLKITKEEVNLRHENYDSFIWQIKENDEYFFRNCGRTVLDFYSACVDLCRFVVERGGVVDITRSVNEAVIFRIRGGAAIFDGFMEGDEYQIIESLSRIYCHSGHHPTGIAQEELNRVIHLSERFNIRTHNKRVLFEDGVFAIDGDRELNRYNPEKGDLFVSVKPDRRLKSYFVYDHTIKQQEYYTNIYSLDEYVKESAQNKPGDLPYSWRNRYAVGLCRIEESIGAGLELEDVSAECRQHGRHRLGTALSAMKTLVGGEPIVLDQQFLVKLQHTFGNQNVRSILV